MFSWLSFINSFIILSKIIPPDFKDDDEPDDTTNGIETNNCVLLSPSWIIKNSISALTPLYVFLEGWNIFIPETLNFFLFSIGSLGQLG